jgi:hypothetical protein
VETQRLTKWNARLGMCLLRLLISPPQPNYGNNRSNPGSGQGRRVIRIGQLGTSISAIETLARLAASISSAW